MIYLGIVVLAKSVLGADAVVVLSVVYALAAIWLALYGVNAFVLTFLYVRHRRESVPESPLSTFPHVTVQLPVFDEAHVIERLIDCTVRLAYPRERLQIQVLDDSTDETTLLARNRVALYRARGVDIELLHRDNRLDFKAGALREGMNSAKGELIALFDADFVPPRDFLLKTVPHFLSQPDLGFVQTRWGHVNGTYSYLTGAQTIALDGHFGVEQPARQRSGLFINFNGAGGVWRRQCINDAGGWQGDTLCEDMDLSYRAQLAGWKPLYLRDVVCPAEIPPQIHALKQQQARWARGSIRCALKLWRQILKAPVSIFKRVQALIHLTGYLVHPLMLLVLVLSVPFLFMGRPVAFPLAYLSVASLGAPTLYFVAQSSLYPNWLRRMGYFPLLVLLGTGLALSNTKAMYEELEGKNEQFGRTPKFRLEERRGEWRRSTYALSFDWTAVGEVILALYALMGVVICLQRSNYLAIPFLMIYVLGFAYVASLTILHSPLRWVRPRRSDRPRPEAPVSSGAQSMWRR
jgi:cellulose synthase/poly-beta-1,6-N-acetylglucosamine synthase-like glycosyltransferase